MLNTIPTLFVFLAAIHPIAGKLPVIDLGYVRQRATSYNPDVGYYTFRNVRYASAPAGDLRFRKPQPPVAEATETDGSAYGSASCHQYMQIPDVPGFPFGSSGDEDCLFLDIYVPAKLKRGEKVPVLMWWHGGLYTFGSKTNPDPAGIMTAFRRPVIFVSSNYRLGSYGWLAPPGEDIIPNIGLYDVRESMEWIKKYIGKFGGDASHITVMGQSAGGGMIEHALTSYGGCGDPPPFRKAILFSAGYLPEITPGTRTPMYDKFLAGTNCSDLDCLRSAPASALQLGNRDLTVAIYSDAIPLSPGFVPLTDGIYVPIPFQTMVETGGIHHSLSSILVVNNRNENALLTPQSLNATGLTSYIKTFFPFQPDNVIADIFRLYTNTSAPLHARVSTPPPASAANTLYADLLFNCNALWFSQAYAPRSYRYIFNIGTAIHGAELDYTFYNGTGPLNRKLARRHQKIISNFVLKGTPGWRPNSSRGDVAWLNETGVAVVRGFADAERCAYLRRIWPGGFERGVYGGVLSGGG